MASEVQKHTENQGPMDITSFKDQLKEMPFSMRMFSLCMRSLYAEHAVGSKEAAAVKFRKLRDDTRNDAMVYLKTVLPVSMKVVSGISEYFENYEVLSFEEWSEDLEDIIEETEAYRQICEVLLKMHEDILVPMKKREDEAKIILREFQDLVVEYNKRKEDLESSAATKRKWAIGLCWIPFVNVIASPLLGAGADSDLTKAVAQGAEAKIQEAAALVLSDIMIPALKHMIDGLSAAASFFSVMTEELRKFKSRGEKGLENPKKRHYIIMKKEAVDIKYLSREFYAILPGVRTDFEAIPTEGTDENYVDKWMKKQLKEISKRWSLRKLATDILKEIAPQPSKQAIKSA